jgi:hypothetical protein
MFWVTMPALRNHGNLETARETLVLYRMRVHAEEYRCAGSSARIR